MSFEEKSIWIQLVVAIGVYVSYLAVVLAQAGGIPLSEVPYRRPLITAVIIGIVVTIVAHIVIAILSRERNKRDERDAHINRFGESVRAGVLSVTTLVPLGLAMAEFAHFWVANSLYLAFIVADLAAQSTKIVGYRRGL